MTEKPLVIDGIAVRDRRAAELARKSKKSLCLGIIVATDDAATTRYVSEKEKLAERVGWQTRVTRLPADAAENELLDACTAYNKDSTIDGYIVQLPLPTGVAERAVFATVDPTKDADGLNPENLRRLYAGTPTVIPATPRGILTLLTEYDILIGGRAVTVVGQGKLTGKPLAALLEQRGAVVMRVDKSTGDPGAATRSADIVVAAAGQPGLITGDMVKEGVVVIDVGVNKLATQLVGDVDYAAVSRKAAAITPVPGGVGPMTVISLLENLFDLSQQQPVG